VNVAVGPQTAQLHGIDAIMGAGLDDYGVGWQEWSKPLLGDRPQRRGVLADQPGDARQE
jgi:hypothetical protein